MERCTWSILRVVMASIASTSSAIAGATRAEFESLSGVLLYLDLQAVLYDGSKHFFVGIDPCDEEEHFRLLERVTSRDHLPEELLALLDHASPRVRTLAAVALFDREDASYLPAIARLAEDESITFSGHGRLSATWLRSTGIGPPMEQQSVGSIATAMVDFYLNRSGFNYGLDHESEPGFDAYWSTRHDRAYSAGWFAVQLDRASQGTSPTLRDRLDRVCAVRDRIESIPLEDRCMTLLRLHHETGGDVLCEEADLVAMCKLLGTDRLIRLLRGGLPSQDPDLWPPRRIDWPRSSSMLFVLKHADQLFPPEASRDLLQLESLHRSGDIGSGIHYRLRTPWWAVAAARLDDKNAASILKAAMGRFSDASLADDRAVLCAAMWQICGVAELDFIVDWLYAEDPGKHAGTHSRVQFLNAISSDMAGLPLIARIAADARFETLDWMSLEYLIRFANRCLSQPVVTERELMDAWHPFGQTHVHWNMDEAVQKYPLETADLLSILSQWRERVRAATRGLDGPRR